MERIQDTLYNSLDQYTGEPVTYNKVTTWYDGTAMNDSKADGIVYRKLVTGSTTEYFKRNYTRLTIEHFGGKSDPTFDSFPAFRKYVTFCNNSKTDIYIPQGNYLFKADGQRLDIYTSADFGSSNITLDLNGNKDFRMYLLPFNEDKFISTSLTLQNEISLLEEIQTIVNNNLTDSSSSTINQLKNKYVYLYVRSDQQTTDRVETYRLGGNTNPSYYREYFFIDNFGNIQADFYNNNLDLVVDNLPRYTLEAYNFNQKRYLRGGKFNALYTATSETNYRYIGFYPQYICNIDIENIYYDLSQVQNRTAGFIEPLNCFNITLADLSGKPANHTTISLDSSYTVSLTGCTNVNINNITVPDLHKQDQWGTFVTHYCYNVKVSNSFLNRIDSHYRGWNYTIQDCKIGSKGMQLSGGGTLMISNTIVYDSSAFVTGRSDYVSEWEGDVIIKDCGLFANADTNCGIISVATAQDSINAFNFHPNRPLYVIPCMGYNITIDGFFISNAKSRTGRTNSKYYVYKYNLYTLDQNIRLPNISIKDVVVKNISSDAIANNELSVIQFLAFESFLKVKQGNNNNNVTEASASTKPLFQPKYNMMVTIDNCNLYEREVFTIGRSTEAVSSSTLTDVYNASTNKAQMPMLDVVVRNSTNIRPFLLVYRSRISIYSTLVSYVFPLSRSGFYTYNQLKANNSTIVIDNNSVGSIIDTSSARKSDYDVSDCIFDCSDDVDATTASRLNTFFFGFTGNDVTYTPTPLHLHGDYKLIRDNFITDRCRDKLNLIRTASITAGNKPMIIDFLENSLSGNQQYICRVSSTTGLPILRNTSSLSGLKALLTATNTHKEYVYNSGVTTWLESSLVAKKITTQSANYTVGINDSVVLVDASAASRTITLPTAASAYNATSGGYVFTVKKIDASANTVVLKGNGTELIDGSNTQTISTQWGVLRVQSNGTVWYTI